MVKFFLVYFWEFLLGLTLITQVLVPIFVPKLKFFWLFRGKESKTPVPSSLGELQEKASRNKQERVELQDNAASIRESLKDIEDKTN